MVISRSRWRHELASHMKAQDGPQTKRATRTHREQTYSRPSFFDQALHRDPGYLFRPSANLVDFRKDLFEVNLLCLRWSNHCRQPSPLSNPYSIALSDSLN